MEPEGVLSALSLGGNLGDVRGAFREALVRLASTPDMAVVATSSIYRTKPWGKTDQPDFLNMVAMVRTSLPARALLDLCLGIEKEHGRDRSERWGPRTLDIDILTYGDEAIEKPGLSVPHPRLHERAFALVPLVEVAPDVSIGDARAEDLLKQIDATGVERCDGLYPAR